MGLEKAIKSGKEHRKEYRGAKSVGFGVLSIYWNDVKDMYEIETECMGKEFCKQVLNEAQKYILHKSVIIE